MFAQPGRFPTFEPACAWNPGLGSASLRQSYRVAGADTQAMPQGWAARAHSILELSIVRWREMHIDLLLSWSSLLCAVVHWSRVPDLQQIRLGKSWRGLVGVLGVYILAASA